MTAHLHPGAATPSPETQKARRERALTLAKPEDARQELAFWMERKRVARSNLRIMLAQHSRETWGIPTRCTSSLPSTLEMIIFSRQNELEVINEHIAALEAELRASSFESVQP